MWPVIPIALVAGLVTKAALRHLEAREEEARQTAVRKARARARREAKRARAALDEERRRRGRRLTETAKDPRVAPEVRQRLRALARTQKEDTR